MISLYLPRAATAAARRHLKREWALFFLMGQRALLMQIAHPLVARAVREHSNFRRDPLGRLSHTMGLSLKLFSGSEAEAAAAARRVNRAHQRVRGPSYDARDPLLGTWVWATLVDSVLVGHELFIDALTPKEKQAIMDTYRRRIALLGITSGLPATPAALAEYIDGMIASGEVRVGRDAREIAKAILGPQLARPLSGYLARATLPEPLREQYRLGWSLPAAFTFGLMLSPVSQRVLAPLTAELTCLRQP